MPNNRYPGSIFLVAVLYHPTEAEFINGQKKLVVVEPFFTLADDTQSAINKGVMKVPAQVNGKDVDPDRMEVLVRSAF